MIWLKQQERIIKEIGIKYVIDMTRGDAFVLLCWVHYVATHDYSKKENKTESKQQSRPVTPTSYKIWVAYINIYNIHI